VQLHLGDLDQVAAGVIEHRGGHAAHLERLLGEPDAEAAEPLELGVHVVDGERGGRDPASGDTTVSQRASPRGMSFFFWNPSTSV
jgi:hypothetical protein